MSMFPGAGAVVDYNEAGEPMGWDYPSEPDPDDFYEGDYFQDDLDDWADEDDEGDW